MGIRVRVDEEEVREGVLRLFAQFIDLRVPGFVGNANVLCLVFQPEDEVYASIQKLRDETRELDARLGGVDGGLDAETASQIRNTLQEMKEQLKTKNDHRRFVLYQSSRLMNALFDECAPYLPTSALYMTACSA